MTSIWRAGIVIVAAAIWFADHAEAASITFDFDTSTPATFVGEGVSTSGLAQMSGGLTATFIAQNNPSVGFSIQNAGSTFFTLSQFSGNYIYPDSLAPGYLDIKFSQNVNSISLTFATTDSTDAVETPTNLQLTAYALGSSVGSATQHGTFAGDTFPMGTLSFTNAQSFDLVRLLIPYQGSAAAGAFFIDNITVTPVEAVPLPAALPLFATGLGALGLLGWRRKRKAQTSAQ